TRQQRQPGVGVKPGGCGEPGGRPSRAGPDAEDELRAAGGEGASGHAASVGDDLVLGERPLELRIEPVRSPDAKDLGPRVIDPDVDEASAEQHRGGAGQCLEPLLGIAGRRARRASSGPPMSGKVTARTRMSGASRSMEASASAAVAVIVTAWPRALTASAMAAV